MSYKGIFTNSPLFNKERIDPVFSGMIGETNDVGDLAEFIKFTERNISKKLAAPTYDDAKYKNQLIDLLKEYKYQTEFNAKWLSLVGLLERKIIQLRLYRNIYVSFSTQLQKSGPNTFNYILLRAPFMNLYYGRKEIRIYYKKLEDFPDFKSIEELKDDPDFKQSAIKAIRQEMEKLIENEDISLDYISKELRKIEEEKKILLDNLSITNQKNMVSQFRLEIENLKNIINTQKEIINNQNKQINDLLK